MSARRDKNNLTTVMQSTTILTTNFSTMGELQLKTPMAFLIFNRSYTTEKVFEVIRQAKPPWLLVVAYGLRPDRADNIEKCKAVRAIIESVKWNCQVLRNYAKCRFSRMWSTSSHGNYMSFWTNWESYYSRKNYHFSDHRRIGQPNYNFPWIYSQNQSFCCW